ncbi:GerAB/ArcD/ProY family transporter [Peribacillus glennii]|uniref:Spore gernimation protein n=1 Tax=Peribacillus glennii TaxID=2303991 RepID=A0A372LJT0_9BACI|nr:endospore germination permease [Peribacillus glennii]RFU66695.1 spore gernimation protein [Peribacillus glennii]
MDTPKKITDIQTASIVISSIIGVGVLPLPLFAVRAGNTAAPIVTLIGIAISLFALFIITVLGMRHPNKTIFGYSEEILGKWLGRFCNIFVILFFALLTALGSREFGAVVTTAILRETPIEVTVLVMLLLAAITSRNDLNTFAYIHTFYLPVIISPVVIIVVLSLQNANALYLQPLLGNDIGDMFKGSLTIASLCQWSFVLTIIIPLMLNPKRAMRTGMTGLLIAGGILLMLVVASVAVFGAEETKKLLWPTLELARTTTLPGDLLQRMDVVFLTVWVTAVFTTLLSGYTFICHALSGLFRLRDHKIFSFSLLPIIFVLSMLPGNLLQMYKVIEFVGRFGLIVTIGYPCILLAIDLIRNKRGKRSAPTNM